MWLLIAQAGSSPPLPPWLEITSKFGPVATLLGILITLISVLIQRRVDLVRQRRERAVKFMEEWELKTGSHRKTIEQRLGCYWDADQSLPAEFEPHAVANAKEGTTQDGLKDAVISLMNWFDDLAVCLEYSLVDEEIVNQNLRVPITRFYQKIWQYEQAISARYSQRPAASGWPSAKRLITDWWSQDKDFPRSRSHDSWVSRFLGG